MPVPTEIRWNLNIYFLWSQQEFTYTLSVGRPIKNQKISGVKSVFIYPPYMHRQGISTDRKRRKEEALKVKWGSKGILPILAEEEGKKNPINANSSWLMCRKFLIMVISDAWTLLDFAACYIS